MSEYGRTLVLLMLCASCATCMAQQGNAEEGRRLLAAKGCAACHRIPGVAPHQAAAAPPLDHIGRQSYLAGKLPNNAANMARWIMHPRRINPGSAMPELDITAQEARDMTAYLYQQGNH